MTSPAYSLVRSPLMVQELGAQVKAIELVKMRRSSENMERRRQLEVRLLKSRNQREVEGEKGELCSESQGILLNSKHNLFIESVRKILKTGKIHPKLQGVISAIQKTRNNVHTRKCRKPQSSLDIGRILKIIMLNLQELSSLMSHTVLVPYNKLHRPHPQNIHFLIIQLCHRAKISNLQK